MSDTRQQWVKKYRRYDCEVPAGRRRIGLQQHRAIRTIVSSTLTCTLKRTQDSGVMGAYHLKRFSKSFTGLQE